MTRARGEFGLALLLDLAGAALALLVATRTWQTARTPRPRPLADDLLHITGRTVDAAPTALALVALAGVVAVLASRGIARRAIGVVLAAAGAALVWRSLDAARALGAERVRELLIAKHSGVGIDAGTVPHVSVHTGWAVASAACGALVLLAGALIALRGHTWAGMSAKYAAPGAAPGRPADPADAERERDRAAAAMWSALERGEDPTTTPPERPGQADGLQAG